MNKLKRYLKTNGISQKQFAGMLGLSSQGSISRWFQRNQVPAERVLDVEELTSIPAHELNPNVFKKKTTS